ncbi:MAG: AraC family transcriptional regulator [Clostridia bacterium]|nr:AraC family transcriptional regulator [Clostridia bacterium]
MSNSRFEFMTRAQGMPPCQLLYLTASRFENDWHSIRHAHSCAEMFFCTGGRGRFLIQNEALDVSEGDLVLINANVEHTEQSFSDHPLEYVVLGIGGLEFQNGSPRGHTLLSYAADKQNTLFYLKTLLREAECREAYYADVCHNILMLLLVELQRLSDTRVSSVGGEDDRPINKNAVWVKQYIDEHYGDKLTLDKLADIVRMNKYSLGHLFQKAYGISPIHYMTHRRILEGKRLLESTDHGVSQIAEILNFSSLSYFSQRFKKLTGMSPKEYRERCQKRA